MRVFVAVMVGLVACSGSEAGSTGAGTASILKKVSPSSFVTLAEVSKAKNEDAEPGATLETDGTFIIAFEPTR